MIDCPVTVLLIDDQPMIGEAIRRMLAVEKDISFFYCQEATRALEMADDVHPTVILQDLVMPDMDGLLLVRFLRAKDAPTREIPLIVLSSKEEPDIKAQAFALGANDYLVKLPDSLELIARLRYHSQAYNNYLKRREAEEKLKEENLRLSAELDVTRRLQQMILPKATELENIRNCSGGVIKNALHQNGGNQHKN
jgi:sigma-B regulation protein RsbU (phosphoserine phosphatase)